MRSWRHIVHMYTCINVSALSYVLSFVRQAFASCRPRDGNFDFPNYDSPVSVYSVCS